MPARQRQVILGVAASDVHVVANRLIAMHLRHSGFLVLNLGVCTPLAEFAEALRANPGAEAVVIGSLNGHAYEDLRDLPALRAAGALDRPVILGGNLSVGAEKDPGEAARFLALGVDRVLDDPARLVETLDELRAGRAARTAAAGSRELLPVSA